MSHDAHIIDFILEKQIIVEKIEGGIIRSGLLLKCVAGIRPFFSECSSNFLDGGDICRFQPAWHVLTKI